MSSFGLWMIQTRKFENLTTLYQIMAFCGHRVQCGVCDHHIPLGQIGLNQVSHLYHLRSTVETFILSNFLWSITPLFEHILLHMHYKICSKSGVMDHKKFNSKNFSTVMGGKLYMTWIRKLGEQNTILSTYKISPWFDPAKILKNYNILFQIRQCSKSK